MTVKTSFVTKENIPFVIEPVKENISFNEFLELLKAENPFFKKALIDHGVLLLRGFPIGSAEDFHQTVAALDTGKPMDYIGGDSPRSKQHKKIYTSTEAPPSLTLYLHNEMSFSKVYPKHIYFYCDIAPQERGETIIGDAKKIFEAVDPAVRNRLDEKQLTYISRYYCKSKIFEFMSSIRKGHKSWIEVFETTDKQELESKCRESGFDYKWLKNEWIEVSQTRPAFLHHPVTGDKVWFNQAHLYDFNPRLLGWSNYMAAKLVYAKKETKLHDVAYGDGTPIARKDLYHIIDVMDQQSVYFPWRKGDVLVCDNIRIMHGRAPFKGKRRILTAMTN